MRSPKPHTLGWGSSLRCRFSCSRRDSGLANLWSLCDQLRLKKAYRQKSLRYHPDKNPSPDAKPIFQKITEAYSILSDDKKRLKYDKSGDMDLEDFDIDQFLNMWVGEMMEDGGVVDDMMQSVLPWNNEDDKMLQFMEELPSLKCGHATRGSGCLVSSLGTFWTQRFCNRVRSSLHSCAFCQCLSSEECGAFWCQD